MYPTILICHYKSISYLHLHLSFNHLNFFGKETFETKKYICKRRNLIYVHYPFIFGLIFFRLVKLQCTLLCKGATQQLCETWRPERKIHSAVLTPLDSNSQEISILSTCWSNFLKLTSHYPAQSTFKKSNFTPILKVTKSNKCDNYMQQLWLDLGN